MTASYDEDFEVLVAGGGNLARMNRPGLETWMLSEVAQVTAIIVGGLPLTRTRNITSVKNALPYSTIIKSEVRSATNFHKDFVSSLKGIHERMQRLVDSFTDDKDYDIFLKIFDDVTEIEKKKLKIFEDRTLKTALLECNRTAVILPNHLFHQLANKVKRTRKRSNVFVGTESYLQSEWMFTLQGALTPHLLKQIKGVHEAGLWERWSKLVSRDEDFKNEAWDICKNG